MLPILATDVSISPPLKIAILIFGAIAFSLLWFVGNSSTCRKLSGWQAIAARFPMSEIHDVSGTYKRLSGNVGRLSCNRGLTIRLAHEGVGVAPSFARSIPCLIPWSSVRKVFVSGASIHLVIDYEHIFEFYLPTDALPAVRTKLAPEMFHQATSISDATRAALKEGKQPRWVSWIVGQTIKSVEKQAKKEIR